MNFLFNHYNVYIIFRRSLQWTNTLHCRTTVSMWMLRRRRRWNRKGASTQIPFIWSTRAPNTATEQRTLRAQLRNLKCRMTIFGRCSRWFWRVTLTVRQRNFQKIFPVFIYPFFCIPVKIFYWRYSFGFDCPPSAVEPRLRFWARSGSRRWTFFECAWRTRYNHTHIDKI